MRAPEPVEIVLVGDIVDDGPTRATLFDWDNPTWEEVRQIERWVALGGMRSQIVSPVAAFPASAALMRGNLILPLWRGGASSSRTALVPAICEALGLAWIGADAFGQSVCQDKSLSKHYMRAAGFVCPNDVVVRSAPLEPDTRCALRALALPAVAKPLFSACSIGIESASLCHCHEALIARAETLLEEGLGPVICEPFVPGEEISLCLVEARGKALLRCVAAYQSVAGRCPFQNRLMTFEDKIAGDGWTIASYGGALPEDLWTKAERLLRMIGPMHLFRIDGRITSGRFTAIEITPDIHLGLDSAFLGGFVAAGIPPQQVLRAIVDVALASGSRESQKLTMTEGAAATPLATESV